MLLYISLAAFAVISIVVKQYSNFQRNLAKARTCNLQLDHGPIFMGRPEWMVLGPLTMPIARVLPRFLTKSWIDVTEADWPYRSGGWTPFAQRKSDWVTVVSPGGIYMSIANAEAISQICDRRADFEKPVEVYELLNHFGTNLVSTDGEMWRQQRKICSPAFTEKNNALVWGEAIRQSKGMIGNWTQQAGNSAEMMLVKSVQSSATELALHIISRAAFGIRLLWSHESVDADDNDPLASFGSRSPPKGHDMTFKDALKNYLEYVLWYSVVSPDMLKWLPFKTSQRAYRSWKNLDKYWNEILDSKIAGLRDGDVGDNLMSRLVVEAGMGSNPADSKSGQPTIKQQLKRSEVVGNAYIFMFAGHETTANCVEYCMILLATDQSVQRMVQRDIDTIVGDTPPDQWDYRGSCDALCNSMLGATIHEQLRLFPPVIVMPKALKRQDGDKTIAMKDRTVVVPAGTFMHMNGYSVHRNPSYWPHKPSGRTQRSDDLNDFVPQRWFAHSPSQSQQQSQDGTNAERNTGHMPAQTRHLFTPPRGAFLPFSDGQRACLGRRFAIVELVAVLAYIFRHYSVELGTDDWAREEELPGMGAVQRQEVYRKAVDRAWNVLDRGLINLLTLKVPMARQIPLRLVRRGTEWFRYD